MRVVQLVRFAAHGLRRQKVRTLLTAVGVAVGTCTLAVSLALGLGLRGLVEREFKDRPGFWQVTVFPGGARPADPPPADAVSLEGTFAPDRAARLRDRLLRRYREGQPYRPAVPLDDAAVAALAALPDVLDVRTERNAYGRVTAGDRTADAQVVAARCDVPELESRLLAGRLPGDADGPLAVVTEGLLYDLGARDEAAFAAAVGRPLGVAVGPPEAKGTAAAAVLANVLGGGLRPAEAAAVGKLLLDMPRLLDQSSLTAGEKATLRAAFTQPGQARPLAAEPPLAVTVAGVVRAAAGDDSDVVYRFRGGWVYDRGDVFLPRPVGEPMLRRLPAFKAGLYDTAGVRVRPGADLPAVAEAATRMGFRTASAAEWYAGARMQVTAITGGLNVFGLLALFVAGLGITNTLVTSVIERTGEIGVLRAVGATAAQVRGLFLAEGGLIGLAGGLVGLAAARLAAGPADRYVLRVARDQTRGERLLSETVFEFPWWLSAGAVLFAVLVTTLAAAYPARRAARLTPVEALRYG